MVVVAGLHFTSYYKGVKLPILRLPIQLKKHQRFHWCSCIKRSVRLALHQLVLFYGVLVFERQYEGS